MHTTVIRDGKDEAGDIRIHHNGDWSGNATLQWTAGKGTSQLVGMGSRALREMACDLRDVLDKYDPDGGR